ncbi:hypothetical protein PIROE2DRAFT_11537 [Piromyces sp. E2]|nr:hypothetical protein PIROE2DRAFT_11537 [Piromyces sp. E2]|eukprot:OUM62224.1 hypothetical protein PIROE2DRAFT_11537 [Piromyces sp. E2]
MDRHNLCHLMLIIEILNNSENIYSEYGLNNSNNENNHNSNNVNEYLSVNNLNATIIETKLNRENLCKYQLKSGSLSGIPFLTKTAAFFNKVMSIVSSQRWSVLSRYSIKVTKSANADNTGRLVVP